MDDDVMLSRWLEDDLEPAEATVLEDRLAREPELAARADALGDALWSLGENPDAEVPEPAALRLRQRLVAETGPGAGRTGATPPGATARRPGAGRRRAGAGPAWALGGAAAALVLVVAIGGLVRSGVLDGSGDESASSAEAVSEAGSGPLVLADGREVGPAVVEGGTVLLAPPGPPGAAARPDGDTSFLDEEAAQEQEEAAQDGAAAAPESEGAAASSAAPDDALRARFTDLPEAGALLGLDADEADEVGEGFRSRIAAAGPFADGSPTAACLDDLMVAATEGAPAPVPVRVERTTVDGQDALVAVLVGASTGSPRLDRVEIWVLDPVSCGVRRFLTL